MKCTVGGKAGTIRLYSEVFSDGSSKSTGAISANVPVDCGSPPKKGAPPKHTPDMFYRGVYRENEPHSDRLYTSRRRSLTSAVENLLLSAQHKRNLGTEEKAQIWSDLKESSVSDLLFPAPSHTTSPVKKRPAPSHTTSPIACEGTEIAPVSTEKIVCGRGPCEEDEVSDSDEVLDSDDVCHSDEGCDAHPIHVFVKRNASRCRTGVIRTTYTQARYNNRSRRCVTDKNIRCYLTFGNGNKPQEQKNRIVVFNPSGSFGVIIEKNTRYSG